VSFSLASFFCNVKIIIIDYNDTTHQVLFLKEIQKLLSNFAQEKIIIGGNFNCALSPNDKDGGNPTSKKRYWS